ncbi:MAG: hypothetical protein K0U59_09950 [Gammaproteobacteria bacterium]|nr:hypothetical protein [Gammaproteobacteria bacterium]
MKNIWIFCTGFLLVAGCSTVDSNPSSGSVPSVSIRAPALDGFWCDLTGTPTTYFLGRVPLRELPAFPRYCLPGNYQVSAAQLCHALEGPCYQLDTGSWCQGVGSFQSPKPYL